MQAAAPSFPVGQEKPRLWWLALILAVLVPGLGHLYTGRWRAGLLFSIALPLLAVVVFWTYVARDRDLVEMMGVARGVTVALWAAQAIHAALLAKKAGAGYRLTRANHPGAYFAFVGATRLFSMLVERTLVGMFLLGVVPVEGQGMAPALVEGDQVAVVRWGFDPAALMIGDVVLYEAGVGADGRGAPAFGRVVARAGQTIAFQGPVPVVDGVAAPRRPCTGDERARLAGVAAREVEWSCEIETLYGREHPVIVTPPGRADLPVSTVPEGMVFLVGDDRDRAVDSRAHGPVPVERVLGRVRAVVSSRHEGRAGDVR